MPYLFPLPPHHSLCPPPPLCVLLLAPGRTIKSFPGLSHPMSRMMRICSLNQFSSPASFSVCPPLHHRFRLFIASSLYHVSLSQLFVIVFQLFYCRSFSFSATSHSMTQSYNNLTGVSVFCELSFTIFQTVAES